jgi:outer membrane protein assembly factor BamE
MKSYSPQRFARTGLVAAALTALLGGCANSFISDGVSFITPYRVEIMQGNVITREQIERVKVGMSRDDVRNVLGAPLLTDIFHADRWDYVFTIRRNRAEPVRRGVVAWFENDRLKKLDAPGDLPSENEFVASIARDDKGAKPAKLALTDEERQALPVPEATPPKTVAAPTGPRREYPPLEPKAP